MGNAPLFSLFPNWGKWNLGVLKMLIPASFFGIWVGVNFLVIAPSAFFRILLGILALIFVLYEWLIVRRSSERKNGGEQEDARSIWKAALSGFLGGVAMSITHAGGMIFSMYLIRLKLSKQCFVATLIILLTVTDIIKGVFYSKEQLLGISNFSLTLSIILLGFLGVVVGTWLQRFILVKHFRIAIFIVLTFSGIVLITTST